MVYDRLVKVSKEADELAQGFVKFAAALKGALDDGWQPGTDLPVLLTATMADLVPAFQGVDKLGAEKHESLSAFVRAFECAGHDMAFLFLSPVVPVA